VSLCEGGIRITVGTEKENELLIDALKNLNEK
jgi:histidinol-phosphate aminotransferase